MIKIRNDANIFTNTICKTPLPVRSYGYSLTSIQGEKIFFSGGCKFHPYTTHQPEPSSIFYEGVLDKSGDEITWTKRPSFSQPKAYHAGLYQNNKIFIVGGVDVNGKETVSCEVYDMFKEEWSQGRSLPFAITEAYAINDKNNTFSIIK